jgi:hypothetical protein
MSAGQHKDNEDKDVMGYELPRRARGEKELVRVSPANRDILQELLHVASAPSER